MIIDSFLTRLQLTFDYLEFYESSNFDIKWTIMSYIMIIILSRICDYVLFTMDHNNIIHSSQFKSHLDIKYQGFIMIFTVLPMNFIAIDDIQLIIRRFLPGNIIHGTYE